MGTHISKVRSVTLDKWTKEQVDTFKELGNKRVNRYYEARMPDDYERPRTTDDYGMEKFIRAKYEQKRWVSKNSSLLKKSSDPATEGAGDEIEKSPRMAAPPQPVAHIAAAAPPPPAQQPVAVPIPQANFFDGPLLSAPGAAVAGQQQSQLPAFMNTAQQPTAQQQQQQNQLLQQRPQISKEAIMSLYTQPLNPQQHGVQQPVGHGTGYYGGPNYNVHLMTGATGGAPVAMPVAGAGMPMQMQMGGMYAMPVQQQPMQQQYYVPAGYAQQPQYGGYGYPNK